MKPGEWAPLSFCFAKRDQVFLLEILYILIVLNVSFIVNLEYNKMKIT